MTSGARKSSAWALSNSRPISASQSSWRPCRTTNASNRFSTTSPPMHIIGRRSTATIRITRPLILTPTRSTSPITRVPTSGRTRTRVTSSGGRLTARDRRSTPTSTAPMKPINGSRTTSCRPRFGCRARATRWTGSWAFTTRTARTRGSRPSRSRRRAATARRTSTRTRCHSISGSSISRITMAPR